MTGGRLNFNVNSACQAAQARESEAARPGVKSTPTVTDYAIRYETSISGRKQLKYPMPFFATAAINLHKTSNCSIRRLKKIIESDQPDYKQLRIDTDVQKSKHNFPLETLCDAKVISRALLES